MSVVLITSLGVDLSTSATGVVLLQEAPKGAPPKCLLETEIKFPKLAGIERSTAICHAVMQVAQERKPGRIVLEGYSLNMKNASSVIPLVELGGLLRFFLRLDGFTWFDPRATQVKQFATGKGTSPKDVVMMHVLKRWGHESKTNNTADAYVCAAIGLAQCNRLHGVTVPMRAIGGELQPNSN
jgi:crossover junction endodeoxyribonuclease RuvC